MSVPVLPSPEIWHRDDFPLLCNWRKLWRMAEVGVDRGEFAQMFLPRWLGEEYWAIDDWAPYGEMPYPREADYQMAVSRLTPHARRAKVIRLPSVEAARCFQPGSLDFIYIDGAHTHEAVAADLRAWLPKLAPGGILAGHDWTDQPHHAGVRQAVLELARERGWTVYLTAVAGYDRETCPSWYVYPDGIPGPGWRRC